MVVFVRKILAREILISVGLIFILLMCWIGCLGFNLIQDMRLDNNINQKMELLNSDAKKLELVKLKERSNLLMELDPINYPKYYDLIWKEWEHYSDVDSVDYLWSDHINVNGLLKLQMLGIGNASELNEFIIRTRITELERVELNDINERIEVLNFERTQFLSKYDRNDIIDLLWKVGWISSVFVFGLRYAYYVISWSIRELFKSNV